MPTTSAISTPYFATLDAEQIGAQLDEKKKLFERYMGESGMLGLYQRAHRNYHSQGEDGFTSFKVGLKGEKKKYASLRMEHFRSIVRRWVSLAHSQRSVLQPIAKFRGYESTQQVKLCKSAIEHWMQHSKVEERIEDSIEFASYLGAGHLQQEWNDSGGGVLLPMDPTGLIPDAPQPPGEQPPGPETTGFEPPPPPSPPSGDIAPLMLGTLDAHTFHPLDFILDPMLRGAEGEWCITRRLVNKYNLIARYAKGNQELADEIFNTAMEQPQVSLDLALIPNRPGFATELVVLHQFWHEKTPACPKGLQVTYLNAKTILAYSELKYRRVPVERMAPANIRGTPFGFTEGWCLLAPQEAADALASIQLSNMKTYGVGTMMAPRTSNMVARDISEGLKLMEYTPSGGLKPEPLMMPATPVELPNTRKQWIGEMGTIIGVSDASRGAPQASLESGSSLAIMVAQGVEATTPVQTQIARFTEAVGFSMVAITQDNLKGGLRIAIVGESVSREQEITGKDIDTIIRVEAKGVSPLMASVGGRKEIADKLAERFPEKVSPSQYFKVVEDGKWEEITEAPAAEESNIARENEMLARGIGPPPPLLDPATGQPVIGPDGRPVPGDGVPGQEYVRAIITDDPIKHILRHRAVLDSESARDNPATVKATLDHIEDHENKYGDLTVKRPGLLQILGLQPLQSALPPPPMPGAPGAPAGPGPVKQPGARPPGPPQPQQAPKPKSDAGPPQPGGMPKQPMYPTNPETGARYKPPEQQ